jgi:GT2 family glycosyltransferase
VDGKAQPLDMELLDPSLDVYAQLLGWQLPQTGGALWRTTLLRELGGWDERSMLYCDEHDLYTRALMKGARFHYVPAANAIYRRWSESTWGTRDPRGVIRSRTAITEALRDWLKEKKLWNEQHARAAGRALFEMARSLAKYSLDEAAEYHGRHRKELHIEGLAAPLRYRFTYRLLSFRGAEWLARLLR